MRWNWNELERSLTHKLIRKDSQMLIVVVGVREDEEVYEIARRRKAQYQL